MKLMRTFYQHDCSDEAAAVGIPVEAPEVSTDIVEFDDSGAHPIVQYLRSDSSVLQVVVQIEDGTLIKYVPLEDL